MKVINQAKDGTSGNIVTWVTDAPDAAGNSYPGPGVPSDIAVAGYLNDAFPKRFKSTIAPAGQLDCDVPLAANRYSQVTVHVVVGNVFGVAAQAISSVGGYETYDGIASIIGTAAGYDFDPFDAGVTVEFLTSGGAARVRVANPGGSAQDVLVLVGVQDFEVP